MKKEIKKEITKKVKKVKSAVIPETTFESKDDCCCQEKTSRKFNISTIILLLILIAGAGVYIKFVNAATVNGKPISRIEYINLLQKQDKKSVLNQMIQESLIKSEATKKNVKVEQSEIDAEIAKIETQIKAQGQTLDAAMAAEGITKSELEKQLSLRKLVEKLSNPTTEITQAQIDEFLTKNKEMLPKDMDKDKLQSLAKEELISQAKSEAASAWLKKLTDEATIVFK